MPAILRRKIVTGKRIDGIWRRTWSKEDASSIVVSLKVVIILRGLFRNFQVLELPTETLGTFI
jgi:hypothetical protein